ncbi:MAG TPA: nucleotide exchange factor GrpE [Ktedonobacteraceae bacterium]
MSEDPQEMAVEQNNDAEPQQSQQEPQQQQSPEAARITELEAQLAQARQESAENWSRFVRERADLENYRKRQERLLHDRVQQQKKELLFKLLDVIDNVERALVYQDTMNLQDLQQTLRMFHWQMNEVMRNEGINPVSTVGEAFNPYLHEAIEAIENSGEPEGTIIEEVRKGYTLGSETLRPARVKVSAGSNK